MSNSGVITNNEIIFLPVDKVVTNPYQPRKNFDRAALEELAESIKQYGVIQPITVRKIGQSYELVTGERRLRASRLAGAETIPAIVVNIAEKDSSIIAIVENLQRENLNFLEEAEGYQNLIKDYSFTQEDLARVIGKSQSSIANKLRVLRLSPQVKKLLLANNLTERHARALLKIEDEEELQLEVIKKVIDEKLTVSKTEEYIETLLKKMQAPEPEKKHKQKIKHYVKDLRLFTNTVKQAVEVMKNSGMSTEYVVNEMEDGCEIRINIKY